MLIPGKPGLDQLLHRIVRENHGEDISIEHVESRPSGYSSSYDAQVITMHLSNNIEWQVFLKDLSHSRFAKDDIGERRRREVQVYRDLLAPARLGTPVLYDAVWDGGESRFWLLMEYLPGRPLSEFPQDFWVQAFGWLGQLHGHFARKLDYLKEASYLVRHDADFYFDRLERSRGEVAIASPELLSDWRDLSKAIEPLINEITEQPRTLVHGDYNPRNILVYIDDEKRSRFSPVDWERAAIGSAYFDMAMLADGFELSVLKLMFDTYRREAASYGMLMPDDSEMLRLLRNFQLFRIVTWLSRAHQRKFSRNKIGQLISMADATIRDVGLVDYAHSRGA